MTTEQATQAAIARLRLDAVRAFVQRVELRAIKVAIDENTRDVKFHRAMMAELAALERAAAAEENEGGAPLAGSAATDLSRSRGEAADPVPFDREQSYEGQQCQQIVYVPDPVHTMHYAKRQCSRRATENGYCWQHPWAKPNHLRQEKQHHA